jgi:hypothetical protein
MSGEALRAMFYAIGSTLILVGGLDDALVAAGIPALGFLSATMSKAIFGLGTLAVGYAKTGRIVGDFALKDVSQALRDTVAPAKPAEPVTTPGVGPKA